MKQIVLLLSLSILTNNVLCMEHELLSSIEPTTVVRSIKEVNIEELRTQILSQTQHIQSILETLCNSVKISSLQGKEELCSELELLHVFVQTMIIAIPSMSFEQLDKLSHVNDLLLTQLHEQLSQGDLCGVCSIDSEEITALQWQRTQNSAQDLQEQVAVLDEKITTIQEMLETFAHNNVLAATANDSFLNTLWNNKVSIAAVTAVGVGTVLALRTHNASEVLPAVISSATKTLTRKALVYGSCILYLLRIKKNADVAKWANALGKDSFAANTLLNAKYWVGSPKEKKTAVHVIARPDMTAQEQIDWAKQNNCGVVRVDAPEDWDSIKNFFEFEDGLYKIPLSLIFAQQVTHDIHALADLLGNATGGLAKEFCDLVFPKKK